VAGVFHLRFDGHYIYPLFAVDLGQQALQELAFGQVVPMAVAFEVHGHKDRDGEILFAITIQHVLYVC